MPSPTRLLQSSSHSTAADPPIPLAVDSDIVVVLAALLCALVCVLGLAVAARCSFLRRSPGSTSSSSSSFLPPNKGIKKKALESLPTVAFSAGAEEIAECAICLAEFADGDRIRILPQCGHGFHVACIDTWLRTHSTCPSCRRILVVSDPSVCCCASSEAVAVELSDRGGCSSFLP